MLTTTLAGLLFVVPASSAKTLDGGIYIGCVESAGEMVPVATTFFDRERNASGAYVIAEKDGSLTRGLLKNSTRDAYGRSRFTWEDKYGSGSLTIVFSSGGAEFSGIWLDSASQAGHLWWGKRTDNQALDDVDCGSHSQT